jgi:methionyl-tRNA synthetase
VSRFFLTTAIDFVNSRPHLGTAYEKVCADVIARYKRLCGVDTRFLMGNDEHSQNVYRSAVEQGLDPLAYCDRMEHEFTRTWRHLDVSFDDFIRTTEPRHQAGVTDLVRRIHDVGDIYEGSYEGWYCVGCEAFKQEKDLDAGKCPLHPATSLQWINEKNYFFRLSKYQRPLLEHFERHPEFLQPEIRRNEILRLLEAGLEDISISRAGQAWGIPLPFDPGSVVYVWFDALINYASAVGLGTDPEMLARWWPADLHVIGKDITRFHTVVWPAMLMSAGLPLPRQVFGHGFMTMNGQRMSKSLGTIVDPVEAADRHGADPLRLYLVKEITFGGDGDFSWERYDERYNVDLANNLGNLVSRVSAMAGRYRAGRLQPAGATSEKLAALATETAAAYRRSMDAFAIHEGAAAAFRLVDAANEFIAETAPWTLAKDEAQVSRLTQVLFDASEAIRLAAVLLTPVMPRASAEILRRVGAGESTPSLDRDGRWRTDGERALAQEGPLWPRIEAVKDGGGAGLPARSQRKESVVNEAKSSRAEKPASAPQETASTPRPAGSAEHPAPSAQPQAPAPGAEHPGPAAQHSAPATQSAAPSTPHQAPSTLVSIDDFMKVELRVGKIVAAEAVPKSKKLLKLLIDAGTEQRTIVAGLAESYQPDAMVGRTIVFVANLKPAKLMGIESNGMVLAASPDEGKAELLSFETPPSPGTRVR